MGATISTQAPGVSLTDAAEAEFVNTLTFKSVPGTHTGVPLLPLKSMGIKYWEGGEAHTLAPTWKEQSAAMGAGVINAYHISSALHSAGITGEDAVQWLEWWLMLRFVWAKDTEAENAGLQWLVWRTMHTMATVNVKGDFVEESAATIYGHNFVSTELVKKHPKHAQMGVLLHTKGKNHAAVVPTLDTPLAKALIARHKHMVDHAVDPGLKALPLFTSFEELHAVLGAPDDIVDEDENDIHTAYVGVPLKWVEVLQKIPGAASYAHISHNMLAHCVVRLDASMSYSHVPETMVRGVQLFLAALKPSLLLHMRASVLVAPLINAKNPATAGKTNTLGASVWTWADVGTLWHELGHVVEGGQRDATAMLMSAFILSQVTTTACTICPWRRSDLYYTNFAYLYAPEALPDVHSVAMACAQVEDLFIEDMPEGEDARFKSCLELLNMQTTWDVLVSVGRRWADTGDVKVDEGVYRLLTLLLAGCSGSAGVWRRVGMAVVTTHVLEIPNTELPGRLQAYVQTVPPEKRDPSTVLQLTCVTPDWKDARGELGMWGWYEATASAVAHPMPGFKQAYAYSSVHEVWAEAVRVHMEHNVMQLPEVQWGTRKLVPYTKLQAAHKPLWKLVEHAFPNAPWLHLLAKDWGGVWSMEAFNETRDEEEATTPWVHEARSLDWKETLIDMVTTEWKTHAGWTWLPSK